MLWVKKEAGWVGGDVVVHHLEIDEVFLLHGGDPALDLFAVAGDVEEPIVPFAGEAMGGRARRDGSAVDRDREGTGKGAEARVDDVGGAVDCDGEEHVLAHALMTRFKEEHTGAVPDGDKAHGLDSGVHKACVFEAITTAMAGDDLGLQTFGVEPDGSAEENVEAFEGNAGGVSAEDAGEGVVGRCAGARVADACEVGVEV
jgi:hypothetical protein